MPQTDRYDTRTIALHWITALLIVFQWIGGKTIDAFPSGPLRVDARSIHLVCGTLVAIILVFRIVWRATKGRRLPPADAGIRHIIAKAVQYGLYLLIGAMVVAGFYLAWIRGDSVFGLFKIPSLDPDNRALRHTANEIHEMIGWIIIGVAGFHAAAALAHRYLFKDRVLARMSLFD